MKRLIAMLMVMCMVIPASGGLASSLFTLPAASHVEEAPSYGASFNVKPASESSLEDGGTKQVYTQVQDQNFLEFGVRLAENGYIAESQQMTDGFAETTVVKGDIRFTVGYDQKKHTLSVVYPYGVNIERIKLANPFEADERSGKLIRVEMGETFQFPGVCNVTVKDFHLNEEIRASGYSRFDNDIAYTWIKAEVENISNNSWYAHICLDPTLHYVDENGHYLFENDDEASGKVKDGYLDKTHCDIGPLYSALYGYGFKSVPEKVRTSTDGYLAVTFSVSSSDQQFIIYFREP